MRVSGEKKLKKSGNLFPKKPWRRAAAGAGLFFMLLAALFFAGLKGTSLQAQVAPNLRDFTAENYVQHVLVLRNGSVRLHLYTDLRTQREVQNITLMLPYQEGQSLSLESFKIAEVDETGKSFNGRSRFVHSETVNGLRKPGILRRTVPSVLTRSVMTAGSLSWT